MKKLALVFLIFLSGCNSLTESAEQQKRIDIVESCLQTQRTSQECLDIANELVK